MYDISWCELPCFLAVPAESPRNMSGQNASSTVIALQWLSMHEVDGDANGKVGLLFCTGLFKGCKTLPLLPTNKGRFCNNSEIETLNLIVYREQSETLSTNKGKVCNNSEIYTLISKWLSIEKKAKLSQITRADFVTIAKLKHSFQSDCL